MLWNGLRFSQAFNVLNLPEYSQFPWEVPAFPQELELTFQNA